MTGVLPAHTEASLTYVAMTDVGRDPIGGSGASMSALRASRLHLISLGWKARISRAAAHRHVALFPALELAISGPIGRNTVSGGYAQQDRVIPSLGIPIEWTQGSTLWIVEPKVVWFDSSMPDSVGGVTQGFGRVIGLGVGIVGKIDENNDFVADILAVLDGDNTIDERTNTVEDQFVWSAGIRWHRGSEKVTVIDLFITNSAGPTTATSLIGAPDNSKGLGIRVEHEF